MADNRMKDAKKRLRLFSVSLNPNIRSGRKTEGAVEELFNRTESEPAALHGQAIGRRCELRLLAAGAGEILHASLHAIFHHAGMTGAG